MHVVGLLILILNTEIYSDAFLTLMAKKIQQTVTEIC